MPPRTAPQKVPPGRHLARSLWGLAVACRGATVGGLASPATDEPTPAPTQPAASGASPTQPSQPAADAAGAAGAADANGALKLCPGGLRLCDDFEATPLGAAPDANVWEVVTQNSTSKVVVDGGRFVAGTRSLHITTANQGFERAVIVNKTALPAPGNEFFGRAFLFVASQVPQIHFDLMSASGVLAGQSQPTSLNIGGQYGLFLANYYNAQDPAHVLDLWQHAGTQVSGAWSDATYVPTNRWTCLEWHLAGATNLMEMWLDGQAVPRMTLRARSTDCCPETVWQQPTFDAVALGWTVVANQEPIDAFDLWLDGVALAGQRIGCGR